MSDGPVCSRTITDPMPLTKGERVHVENGIDARFAERDKRITAELAKIRTISWVALGMSLMSLLVQLARIISIEIHTP